MNRIDIARIERALGLPAGDPAERLAAATDRVAAARGMVPEPPAPWCPADCPGLKPGTRGVEINEYAIRETMMRCCFQDDTIAKTEQHLAEWQARCDEHRSEKERPCDREAIARCREARKRNREELCPFKEEEAKMVECFGYPPPRTDADLARAREIDAARQAAAEEEWRARAAAQVARQENDQ